MLKSKIFLREIREETSELMQLRLKREWLYSTLLPKGITYKTVDVQESGPTDQMSEKFGEIYELDKIIEERMHGLLENHLKAETYVSRLADTRHRKLIEMYYLSEKKTTWEKVADDMGYSIREVYNIHGNALTELEKIMEESA